MGWRRGAMALGVALAVMACGGEEEAPEDAISDATSEVTPDAAIDAGDDVAADAQGPDADAVGPDLADAPADGQANIDVTFSDVRAEEITETGAVIRFVTSAPVLGSVEYGESGASLDNVAVDPSADPSVGRTSHAVALSSLSPETDWAVRARGVDTRGVLHVSTALNFTTLAPAAPPVTGNVALATHGTTIFDVSSNFGGLPNSSSRGANKAIDGDLETQWASNADGDAAFIELDLGALRTVARVGIRAYAQPPELITGHIKTARVLFDGKDPGLGIVSLEDPDEVYSFDLPTPVAVRRVRVEAVTSSGGNTGLREVQLFTP
ncbi:MAG: discoidin domain-containing protein [Myxococcota bacterium]